jgi:hypothetical protein
MENPLLSPVAETPELDTCAIWTVRYIDPSGFECQLSLEGSSGIEVLKKAESAIERLKEAQCSSIVRVPTSTPDKEEEKKEDEHLCPIHQIPMKLWQKNGRSWYSHRWNGSWCKGE